MRHPKPKPARGEQNRMFHTSRDFLSFIESEFDTQTFELPGSNITMTVSQFREFKGAKLRNMYGNLWGVYLFRDVNDSPNDMLTTYATGSELATYEIQQAAYDTITDMLELNAIMGFLHVMDDDMLAVILERVFPSPYIMVGITPFMSRAEKELFDTIPDECKKEYRTLSALWIDIVQAARGFEMNQDYDPYENDEVYGSLGSEEEDENPNFGGFTPESLSGMGATFTETKEFPDESGSILNILDIIDEYVATSGGMDDSPEVTEVPEDLETVSGPGWPDDVDGFLVTVDLGSGTLSVDFEFEDDAKIWADQAIEVLQEAVRDHPLLHIVVEMIDRDEL